MDVKDDEQPREAPLWVQNVVLHVGGYDLRFMMEKRLLKSDIDRQQSRLLIPSSFVDANIIPGLSESEKASANLGDHPERRIRRRCSGPAEDGAVEKPKKKRGKTTMISDEASTSGVKKIVDEAGAGEGSSSSSKKKRKEYTVGRKHEGLEITMYTRSRWGFDLFLTRWDGSNSTVVKGKQWKYVPVLGNLGGENEQVEMWGFRRGVGEQMRMCFVIGKKP